MNLGVGMSGQVLVHPSPICQIGGVDQGLSDMIFWRYQTRHRHRSWYRQRAELVPYALLLGWI